MKRKIKKNSLSIKICKYLVLFSIIILAFLWFFQVVFINSYYKAVKTRELRQVAKVLIKKKDYKNIGDIIDDITYNKSICVEIINDNYIPLQSSSFLSGGCMMDARSSYLFKKDFMESGNNKATYELENPKFKNNTLIYAVKLDADRYLFVNTSVEPIDSTISILKDQLVYVTILVFLLSFVIAYFISKHISKPIVMINKSAKALAKGNYQEEFVSEEDIEEINELISTLNYTRCELEKTDQLRRDLMANVSHDLKTPLTMIRAYSEMARDLHNKDEKKRRENLNVIIEEADRLTILVNDILTLSQMQAQMGNLTLEKFDLVELIHNILKRYSVFKELDGYTFKFDFKEKIIIVADKKKIEQVIYNLINNAINYTGNDNLVEIKIKNSEVIRVEIIDTGKGIKEEDIEHIWDKYYKNEKKHKRNLIGTGLGLSIVKNILEEHHFQYGVISKKDQGSTVYFEIQKKV